MTASRTRNDTFPFFFHIGLLFLSSQPLSSTQSPDTAATMSLSRTGSRRSNSQLMVSGAGDGSVATRASFALPPLADAITTCPICTREFDDPRLLQCFHSFCLPCLRACDSTNKPPDIQCPVCTFITKSSAGLDRLPRNYFAAECVRLRKGERSCQNCERQDATQYCRQCASMLCAPCSTRIHNHPIFRKHEVVIVTEKKTAAVDREGLADEGGSETASAVQVDDDARAWNNLYEVGLWSAAAGVGGDTASGNANSKVDAPTKRTKGPVVTRLTCAKHASNELTLYCSTCKEAVCNLCVPEHTSQRHKLVAMDTVAKQIQRYQIPSLHKFLDVFQQRAEVCANSIQAAREGVLKESYKSTAHAIHAHFDELADAISQRRHQLIGELNDVYAEKNQRLAEQEAMLRSQEHMAVLSRVHSASLLLSSGVATTLGGTAPGTGDEDTRSCTSDITVRKLQALEVEWQGHTSAIQERRSRHQQHAASTSSLDGICESNSAVGNHLSQEQEMPVVASGRTVAPPAPIADPATMKALLSHFNVFPSNSGTPSVVCDVGGSCSTYETFLRSLEASDEPCVDLDIRADFTGNPSRFSGCKEEDGEEGAQAESAALGFSHAWLVASFRKRLYGSIECRRGARDRTFPLPALPGSGETLSPPQAVTELTLVRDGHHTPTVDPRRGVLYCIGCGGGRRLYQNPALAGSVSVVTSSIGVGRREQVVGPGPAAFCTLDQLHAFVEVSLSPGGMSVKNFQGVSFSHGVLAAPTGDASSAAPGNSKRAGGGNYIRSWVVLGLPSSLPYRPPPPSVPPNAPVDDWRTAAESAGWVLLQEHEGDETLSGDRHWGVWGSMDENGLPFAGPFHAFRVQLTGRNSSQCNHLMISGVEIYGTLTATSPPPSIDDAPTAE